MKYKVYKTVDKLKPGDKVVYRHISKPDSLISKEIYQVIDDEIYVIHGDKRRLFTQKIDPKRIYGFVKKKWYDFIWKD